MTHHRSTAQPGGLTPRQARFAAEYVLDLCGTQAAIRAGYSAATANQTASRLLAQVNVAARVVELQRRVEERTQISVEKVVREIARRAFADVNDFLRVTEDGTPLIDLRQADGKLPPNAMVRQRTIVGGDPNDSLPVLDTQVTIPDQARYLDLLMRHLGGYAPAKVTSAADADGRDLSQISATLQAAMDRAVDAIGARGCVQQAAGANVL